MPSPVRLLIAEDHDLMGQGLRSMLESNALTVVGIVRDGGEVAAAVCRHRPDVLLLDLSMPTRSGIDLIPELRTLAPAMRILVVTMHLDALLADTAMRLGAHGFVPKDSGIEELRTAIAAVQGGETYVSSRVSAERPGLANLTPRQLVILRLIGEGTSTETIAKTLGVSIHPVHFHRRNIHHALGLETELDLVRYAVLANLTPKK